MTKAQEKKCHAIIHTASTGAGTVAKTFLATTTATMVDRGISQVLVGWIPGIGNIFNAVTAAGVTETIGWTIVKNFDKSVGLNP